MINLLNFLRDSFKEEIENNEIEISYDKENDRIIYKLKEEDFIYDNRIEIHNEFIYIFSFDLENKDSSEEERLIELFKMNLLSFEIRDFYYHMMIRDFIKNRIEYLKNLDLYLRIDDSIRENQKSIIEMREKYYDKEN